MFCARFRGAAFLLPTRDAFRAAGRITVTGAAFFFGVETFRGTDFFFAADFALTVRLAGFERTEGVFRLEIALLGAAARLRAGGMAAFRALTFRDDGFFGFISELPRGVPGYSW